MSDRAIMIPNTEEIRGQIKKAKEYVDGLDAYLDESSKVSVENVRDLMRYVRTFTDALEEG